MKGGYYKKKPKVARGYITKYEINETLIPNEYLGQDDYWHHFVTLEQNGVEETFLVRQWQLDAKFEVGTFVAFRYNPSEEARKVGVKHVMESKSFAKAMSPEELAAYNANV